MHRRRLRRLTVCGTAAAEAGMMGFLGARGQVQQWGRRGVSGNWEGWQMLERQTEG